MTTETHHVGKAAVYTPRGNPASIMFREGTTDLATAGSVFAGVVGSGLVDEYDLASLDFSGVFVDVGAHIGAVTVAVLLDNPDARAIAVEPLPENIDLFKVNMDTNGLCNRVSLIRGAVGSTSVQYGPDVHRYIGNIAGADGERVEVENIDLDRILRAANGPITAMKLDCEGGEWALLADPRIKDVPLIFGEAHGADYHARLMLALDDTHEVRWDHAQDGTGNFWAVAR
jgi:FkbM family methyltransferase